MRPRSLSVWLPLVAVLLASTHPASAVAIPSADAGWYDETGFHDPSNLNYVAGACFAIGSCSTVQPLEYRNFFVFDLTSVVTPVAAATLRLSNPPGGYISPDASETYTVTDVSTSIASLVGGTGGLAAFTDLGSGAVYGSLMMTAADNGTVVSIVFSPAGLAAINGALGGTFAVGGFVTTIGGGFPFTELVFGSSGSLSDTRELDLTLVPEPSSMLLLASGVLALSLRHRQDA
jgi:hypothetical protein